MKRWSMYQAWWQIDGTSNPLAVIVRFAHYARKINKEKREAAKKRAEIGRKVRDQEIEASLIEHGVLERGWHQDWKL